MDKTKIINEINANTNTNKFNNFVFAVIFSLEFIFDDYNIYSMVAIIQLMKTVFNSIEVKILKNQLLKNISILINNY